LKRCIVTVNQNAADREGANMKVLRFALLGLCLLGVGVCIHALARLAGWVPPGHLAPYPGWTAAHFVSAAAFTVTAPLQLWPALRAARPRLHRILGRAAVGLGSVMAVSGVAMVHLSPDRPITERIFMTTFFLAYAAMLVLGFRAAVARDIPAHRAWMVRMTATALTPLTQRLVFPVFAATLGVHGLDGFWQLFVSAAWIGWALNMTVAETVLRARRPVARLAAA
jgi:hypothetical protein